MKKVLEKMVRGYEEFRSKYALGDQSIMQHLSESGQQPEIMVVSCCDSRVDPGLIMQCDPGDLFVVRNVANIVPNYEKDTARHGTSAGLEFGICFLKVKHLILLGHSQCGGINALLSSNEITQSNDFITNWVSVIKTYEVKNFNPQTVDDYAKIALQQSYKNCLTFPWIKEKVEQKTLMIHLWFFDIKTGQIFTHSEEDQTYKPLDYKNVSSV